MFLLYNYNIIKTNLKNYYYDGFYVHNFYNFSLNFSNTFRFNNCYNN